MSWLRSNLNISDSLSSLTNLTGQISTFTREMLTEGTEEVADPSAELNVARNHIKELEAILSSQKIEYDRLKHMNDELHERVEAADLQFRTMSQDYRDQLTFKEQEIVSLKAQLHNKEQEFNEGSAGHRQRYDSTDSFDDHEEMKCLKNEIIRLQTECHHWKIMSSGQDSQENLHREIDQYQHELAALQSTYAQKIANLNKKYKGEMQKWEDDKHYYLRKIDDLQHELKILEEVDNLDGMHSGLDVGGSSGDDMAATREELELAHSTITGLRKELDKAAKLLKSKSTEIENVQENLNRTTEEMKDTEEKLVVLQEKEKATTEQNKKGADVQKLQEQLIERENNLAALFNEINLLKEQLQETEVEKSALLDERDGLQTEEKRLRESLEEVKQDLGTLSSSTLELMEELEASQGIQKEQCFEIDCLKKVCTVEGGAKDEILHLKNIISALWERYVATLQLYQQVRHELHNSNHRLLAQLQARHVITPSTSSALAKRKQEELAFSVCQMLLSLITDKERLVELTAKLANTQSVRQQVADVRSKLNTKSMRRQDNILNEKDSLMTKSAELRSQIEEQESLIIDLQADNDQITQETKEVIAEVGCQTANDSLDERNDIVVALEAEKAVLESTIVGLQSKVQDLKLKVRTLKGEPIKADTSDYYFSEDPRLDVSSDVTSGEGKSESMESLTSGENSERVKVVRESAEETNDKNDNRDAIIAQLNQQVVEYRASVEELEYIKSDYEEDKYALEHVVMDLKRQVKEQRENALVNETRKAPIQESGWESIENSEVLDSLKDENEELIKERVKLVKSLRSLEDELIASEIVQEDDMCGFETETERIDALVLNLKDWVIRTRTSRETARSRSDNSMVSVSLDESSQTEEEYRQAQQTIEELEWDNSLLREQTNDLINQIEAKTTEVGLIQTHLEEKCSELRSFDREKQNLMKMINERDEKLSEIEESFDSQLMELTASRENDVEMLRLEQEGILHFLEEKQLECGTLRKTTNELMNSFQEQQQGYEELSEENKSLSRHVHESEILLQDMRNEKENLVALIESKEQLVLSLSDETKSFTTEKKELSILVQECQEKLHVKDQEIANLSHLSFKVEQLGRQALDNEFSRKFMEDKMGTLSGANEKLNTSLKENEFTLDNFRLQLKEKNSEVEYLGVEMDKLNELVGSNVAVRRDLEHQISRLNKENEDFENGLREKESLVDSLKLDLREKGAENDLLRLDVAKVTKTLKEKEGLLNSKAEERGIPGGHGEQSESQAQLSRMLRLLQEKDQEMAAMKQKEASLIAVVNQTDQSSHEALEHYQQQIQHLTEETNRLMAEVNQKDEDLFAMNDKLEVIQEQMQGKSQASMMLHSEHSRLLALNESQGNEIAKLREKNKSAVKLLEEKEKFRHDELHRLKDEFNQRVNALKLEQERLMILLQEKDRQIVALADATVPIAQAHVLSSESARLQELVQQKDALVVEQDRSRHENDVKEQRIAALEGELVSMNHNLKDKTEMLQKLSSESEQLKRNLNKLDTQLVESQGNVSAFAEKDNRINHLEDELKMLQEHLKSRASELELLRECHGNAKDALLHELEDVRIEKEDILLSTKKETNELRNKLLKALNTLGECNFAFNTEGHADVEKNFQSIVQRILNQRNSVLREKDNEIRTLKNQVSSSNVLQQSSGPSDYGLQELLREKEELSKELIRIQYEKEDVLQEKESIVADLQGQIIGLTKLVSVKERTTNHDVERVNRERERDEKELERIRNELSQNQSEYSKLRSESDRLVSLVAEEKCNAAKLHADLEQYKQLLQEREKRSGELAMEREQLVKNSKVMEQKVSLLQNELSAACGGQKETEAKMARELDRLRVHMIQVEESYTREALNAEEREKDLRLRLVQAEEQMLSSSHSMQDRSRQTTQQLDSLQEQLHAVAGQRDDTVMQLAAVQEQAQQYATSLDNLQMVLEQFQREKESELSAVREQARQQVTASRWEIQQMQLRDNELRVQLQNASRVLQEVGKLKQELVTRDEIINQYKVEVGKLEGDLQISHTRIRDMNTSNDDKVDKHLVKNLLTGYFNTTEAKRPDVVHVIGGLLGFTPEEMAKIGSGSSPPYQGGWISSFLPFGKPPRSPTIKPLDKSFSELFVNFLEHESDTVQTPLQNRRGTTSNPLLTGMTPQSTPLNRMHVGDRQPLASSTPIRSPLATGPVPLVTGPVPLVTGPVPLVTGPAPLVIGPARPPIVAAMATGTMSPVVPSPVGVRGSVPAPRGPQPVPNVSGISNPRPQGAQPLSLAGNPLLVGPVAPLQQLPAMSTSSASSSLRNVLFQTGAR